ncbi:hypothetical protein TM49_01520 [Martelella endophytica]|uniref:Tip attachment protein J domain-containing protein n=1 Tax=Martelella endophytica TaxID=1486262 RepID=A0A0D5LUC3_MAREN|nr:hypothetical protein TM49_01520 [Martelella endophytica]
MRGYQRRALLRGSTALYSPFVGRDPITALIGGIFSSGFAGITIGQVVGAIVLSAISIGAQLLFRETPKKAKAESVKNTISQSLPYRVICNGRRRIAGAIMMREAKGKNLCHVQALAAHRISAFNRIFLNDDEVTLQPDGTVNELSDGRYGDGKVWVGTRVGVKPETAYGEIVDIMGADGVWTNNHRGDGQASIGMICRTPKQEDFNKRFPNGGPTCSAEVDGALCWDFRDPTQSATNEATWKFTRNPMVVLAWWLFFAEAGFGYDYQTGLLPVLDDWIEEADICDELIATAAGGTERRYEFDGTTTTEFAPKTYLADILMSCDGWICQRGDGAWLPLVGKFRETKVATITDADIANYSVDGDVLFDEEVNRLTPVFIDPALDYAENSADDFDDIGAQLIAGRVLAETNPLDGVTKWRQARRLTKREFLRVREKKRGQFGLRLSGINAVFTRWVRLETPVRLPELNGRLIENLKSTLDLSNGGFSMQWVLHPDDIDAWNPATDEGAQPAIAAEPNAADLEQPVIQSVSAIGGGGSVYLRVAIDDPEDDSLTPIVRYRVADAGAGSPGGWVEQAFPGAQPSAGSIVLDTQTVPADTLLQVQAAVKNSKGTYSDFSATEEVQTISDPVPAGEVIGAAAVGGAGQATYSWTAPNADNYRGARLYYNTVNSFGTASAVSPPTYGAAGGNYGAIVSGLDADTYFGWITTINRSGLEGDPVATGSFTVT